MLTLYLIQWPLLVVFVVKGMTWDKLNRITSTSFKSLEFIYTHIRKCRQKSWYITILARILENGTKYNMRYSITEKCIGDFYTKIPFLSKYYDLLESNLQENSKYHKKCHYHYRYQKYRPMAIKYLWYVGVKKMNLHCFMSRFIFISQWFQWIWVGLGIGWGCGWWGQGMGPMRYCYLDQLRSIVKHYDILQISIR